MISRILLVVGLGLVLAGPTPAESISSGHIIIDHTGSLAPQSLQATVQVLIESLPDFALAFDLESVEVSPWTAPSTWAPPAAAFDMPRAPLMKLTLPPRRFLEPYFPQIAEKRAQACADARAAFEARADSLRRPLVERACAAGPAPLLRRLAQAPLIPEEVCSPVSELLERCRREPANRVNLLVTDALNCSPKILIPPSANGRTIIILVPSNGEHGDRSVLVALEQLGRAAPWLTVIPASALDSAGRWARQLAASLEPRPTPDERDAPPAAQEITSAQATLPVEQPVSR